MSSPPCYGNAPNCSNLFFRHVIKMAGDRERGLPAKVGIWIYNIFFLFRSFLVLLLLPHLECGSMPGMRIVLNILLFYPPSSFLFQGDCVELAAYKKGGKTASREHYQQALGIEPGKNCTYRYRSL